LPRTAEAVDTGYLDGVAIPIIGADILDVFLFVSQQKSDKDRLFLDTEKTPKDTDPGEPLFQDIVLECDAIN